MAPVTIAISQTWEVDVRLPGKGDSNSIGARPVKHLDDKVDSDQ